MNKNQEKVLNYYKNIESYFGYKYITDETKHFGYYPSKKNNISEKKAQQLMSAQVGKNLQLGCNKVVLDAGCGYGVTACYLANKYKSKIIGIDLNAYELTKAKRRAIQQNVIDKTKFLLMDYTKLNFSKNSFDAIYTLETLSHSPNLKKTLKGFYKILKPNGKIALFEYTLAQNNLFNEYETKMLNIGIEGTAALGLSEFRHNIFPDYLKKIGFKNIKEQNITDNMLPSLKRLKNIASFPYFLIKTFNLQKYFVNTTIAVEWYKLMNKDLIRYCIFTAEK